jgi:hypothetical protein
MAHVSHGRTIGRAIAVIALLLVGASVTMRGAVAQPGPGPGGEPIPPEGPKCEVTRPDLVITSARFGLNSEGRPAYLDVVVTNANRGCSQPAGTFRVSHSTNRYPSIDQHIQVRGGLAAGASITVRFINVPQCIGGETLRGAVAVDSLNQVAERNESNNVYFWHGFC